MTSYRTVSTRSRRCEGEVATNGNREWSKNCVNPSVPVNECFTQGNAVQREHGRLPYCKNSVATKRLMQSPISKSIPSGCRRKTSQRDAGGWIHGFSRGSYVGLPATLWNRRDRSVAQTLRMYRKLQGVSNYFTSRWNLLIWPLFSNC